MSIKSLQGQRVMKGNQIGVIMDDEPDENNCVLVHWGVADGKIFRTVEDLNPLGFVD